MRRKLLFMAIIGLLIGTLGIGACKETDSQSDIVISRAPIHEVRVSIAESYPPQVFVYIKGGLADGCTTLHELEVERSGNTINIEVTTQRPRDAQCTQVYGYFEKNVNLGTDFVSGGTYTINVNDKTTTLAMP